MPRTTKGDFAFYQHEVKYWTDYFGLISWELFFSHQKDGKSLASVGWDRETGNAVFSLATSWGKLSPINEKTLSQSAFHEACELLLSELQNMGTYFVKASEVNRAIHEVVRRLENTIFEYEWKRRAIPQGL